MDDAFRALADPSRRSLLDSLNSRNGQTLGELCTGLDMARQSVSKHLAVLESAGLVVTEWRGREKLHFLNAAPIHAIADRWIRTYDRRRANALADLKTALEHPVTEFVYATYIRTTPERLWQALIDPTFTEQYWGVKLTSDWKAGSPVTWEYAGVVMEHPEQIVVEADEPRRLVMTWHTITPEFGAVLGASEERIAALAAEPRSTAAFDIEPAGELVKLTLRHTGFEPDSEMLKDLADGWPGVIASLKSLLETGEPLAFD